VAIVLMGFVLVWRGMTDSGVVVSTRRWRAGRCRGGRRGGLLSAEVCDRTGTYNNFLSL